MAEEPAVRVDGLSKAFRSRRGTVAALQGISLSAPRRRITCVVGPDGAGKSTLCRALAGLLEIDSGSLGVLGLDPFADAARLRRRIAYVPQALGLHDDLTVAENLAFFVDLFSVPRRRARRRSRELLEVAGLAVFGDRRAGALSGGMKQKLALVCALVRDPELLLLDEPTVGVDPISRREVWRWMRREVAAGRSVLWTTTSLDEAERADHVVLMDAGRVLDQGPPAAFLAHARGRVARILLPPERRAAVAERLLAEAGVADVVARGGALVALLRRGVSRTTLPVASRATVEAIDPTLEDGVVLRLLDAAPRRSTGARVLGPRPAPGNRAPDERPVIAVRDLVRTFGAFRAVDGITFEVRRGEIFGLLGPNGAGKTTTFRMLSGLLRPSGGRALIEGIDLRRAAPRARARVGYMAQRFSLYASLSPRANLRFFASAYGVPRREREQRVEAALDAFDLADVADQRAGSLSYGHRRRLSLAAALLHRPSVLFLDEPTSGADPLGRRAFWRTIVALAASGVTVLVTTHHLDEAEYCDRIAIMNRGRIVALGRPDEVRRRATGDPHASMEDVFVAVVRASEAAA